MRGAPDAVAQWGGERGGFRPRPVGAGDIFSAILLSMPWMLVHLRTSSSNESQGQRSKARVKGDTIPGRPGCTPRGLLDRGVQHSAAR